MSSPARHAASVAVALCGVLLFAGIEKAAPATEAPQQPSAQTAASSGDEQQARAACATCHAFPPPDILPRDAWRGELIRMMFIREGRLPPIGPPDVVNRSVQLPPDFAQVLPFYTSHAPERLPKPDAWPDAAESPLRFTRHSLTMPDMPNTPAVSNVALVPSGDGKQLRLLGTDMRQGVVFAGQPGRADGSLETIASIPHPSHVQLVDVDKDGQQDLLVADLGQFFPADHHDGAVIWLRGLGNGKFGAFWLDGWPRVADAEAADFNGDGVNDLAVAAFGWRKTGQVSILENKTTAASHPAFTNHTIDPRTGAIHVVPVDLNHDGRMDFVALLAQEHETVIAYINKGAGDFTFDQKIIYAAPHPNWGSSGIQLVDLDKDGDLDVLLTHGDTFDDGIVKPYHGIQWLENTGGFPFVEHTLASMPGVHRAVAVDLDGDGDLDIVACALLANGADIDEKTLPALVWLEQTKPRTFARHTIEMGVPRHATLDVGDVDGDGHPDIVVGNFSINSPMPSWVDVWIGEAGTVSRKP